MNTKDAMMKDQATEYDPEIKLHFAYQALEVLRKQNHPKDFDIVAEALKIGEDLAIRFKNGKKGGV